MNPTVFREYDIRGIVGETLFAQDAYYIGKAFASYVIENSNVRQIYIGYDGRLSSPTLVKELIDGLTQLGIDVIEIGLCPTPMLYYATQTGDAPHGIMVTGSHNQPDFNGFKFVFNQKPFYGESIVKINEVIKSGSFNKLAKPGQRKYDSQTFDNYITNLYSSVSFGNKIIKVVWDTSNGAGGPVVETITAILPGTHFVINGRVDGLFPGHDPDPTVKKNLKQLIDFVLKEECDIGIALDGDADRVIAVDNLGRQIPGDQLVLLFAEQIIKKHKNASIIMDIKSSQVVFDRVKELGGVPLMWKTGHSHIKSKMKEIGSKFGGEVSGHIFFADRYYGFDDGIYAALRLIELISQHNTLSEMVDTIPESFITPEVRIECSDERKFGVIEEIKERLNKQAAQYNDIDGLRVECEDGWWLLRVSNTQPALVLRFESYTKEGLKRIHEVIKQQLALSNVTITIAF
ncbi:MAG: phosphomannomutase/phosphoglucomutase [Sphingobacteriia bacterium]|nr:phosphomannomutase/phosphoglucomutase [Sphingobacteriia bacterium]